MSRYNWYVVQAKPGQTARAQQELENQGFDLFVPWIEVEKVKRGKRVTEEEPMFPGYLFIWLSEMESNWRPIRSTRGVARIITFGNKPAIVPPAVVEALRSKLRVDKEPEHQLKVQQKIEITEGPFKGLDAVFEQYDGEQRAFVLLELLGKWQRLSVDLGSIRG
ncbi:transcription/translation regulatory transformer protein RfaH [Marinobacterium mangrovicola]|uniref:Transcriptional antiterminator RfaH n=1 Tax=Marinobacterium mangrovicola TaxID=1476959 RepID=A0A4R1GJ12_9GAMM|nr:transcription/translation regulatory transformer protein RfaH [Marinobacterium mangrovicola]TCK07120.1 transcriptional antiterminator RfaH [Marinobacterium mangrovicola]